MGGKNAYFFQEGGMGGMPGCMGSPNSFIRGFFSDPPMPPMPPIF